SPLSVRFASCLRQDKISLRPPKCLACSALAPLWESLGHAANAVSWKHGASFRADECTATQEPGKCKHRLRENFLRAVASSLISRKNFSLRRPTGCLNPGQQVFRSLPKGTA